MCDTVQNDNLSNIYNLISSKGIRLYFLYEIARNRLGAKAHISSLLTFFVFVCIIYR